LVTISISETQGLGYVLALNKSVSEGITLQLGGFLAMLHEYVKILNSFEHLATM
jgi:hypothetical protein